MPILTLTTDFGTRSFDVAALKGKLMCASDKFNIIDISHSIGVFDKMGAAYAIKNASLNFPKHSIHFTNVNLKEGNNRILIVERNEQFYICPDNGIVSMMFPEDDFKAYVLQGLEKDFSYQELHQNLCEIIKFAETDTNITSFGLETTSYLKVLMVRAAIMPDAIRATVIHIDRYQNAIINVTKEMFYAFVQDKSFTISYRSARAHKINKHYSEVEPGDIVCLFNDAGLLEMAISQGEATQLLGLVYGSIVLIETD